MHEQEYYSGQHLVALMRPQRLAQSAMWRTSHASTAASRGRTVTLSWRCLRVHGGKHPRGSARRSATAPAAPAECDRLTILQKLDPRCLPAFGATKSPTDIAAAEIDKRYKSTCFII